MKLTTCLLVALFSGATAFAQIPGMLTTQVSSAPEGTALGANETLSASGIALGNRAKLRGFVDFKYQYQDIEGLDDTADFNTASDVDLLFDLSPVTAELHLNVTDDDLMEQAFGRYSFNSDFHLTFGRQLTSLAYESDEVTGLHAVTSAYHGLGYGNLHGNYVDGVRLNFNNGQFGFILGLHDGYWAKTGSAGDLNDHFAIDIAASVMIIPGLEARLGFAHEDVDQLIGEDDIHQFNAWIGFNPGDLTLAFEFDTYDIYGNDLWDIMLLANYQFTDWFGATLRYTHEDLDPVVGADSDADRITLALLFAITQNFDINFEYSHANVDHMGGDADVDEVYLQGLISF